MSEAFAIWPFCKRYFERLAPVKSQPLVIRAFMSPLYEGFKT